jgi:hypothetical protein
MVGLDFISANVTFKGDPNIIITEQLQAALTCMWYVQLKL